MRNYYIFITILGLVVLTGLIIGFTIAGNPQDLKNISFDTNTQNNFTTIKYSIESSYQINGKLPTSLSELNLSRETTINSNNKQPYTYTVDSPNSYRLCTQFYTDSAQTKNKAQPSYMYTSGVNNFDHKIGQDCKTYSVSTPQTNNIPKAIPPVKEEVISVHYSKLSSFSKDIGSDLGEIIIGGDLSFDVGPFVHLYSVAANPDYYLFAITVQPKCKKEATTTCEFSLSKLALKTDTGVTIVKNTKGDPLYSPYIHDQIGELVNSSKIAPETANSGFVGFHIPSYRLQLNKPTDFYLTYDNNSEPLKLTLTFSIPTPTPISNRGPIEQ